MRVGETKAGSQFPTSKPRIIRPLEACRYRRIPIERSFISRPTPRLARGTDHRASEGRSVFSLSVRFSEVECDIGLEEFVSALRGGNGIAARQVAVGNAANNVPRGCERFVHAHGPIMSGLQSYSASASDLLMQKIIAA